MIIIFTFKGALVCRCKDVKTDTQFDSSFHLQYKLSFLVRPEQREELLLSAQHQSQHPHRLDVLG